MRPAWRPITVKDLPWKKVLNDSIPACEVSGADRLNPAANQCNQHERRNTMKTTVVTPEEARAIAREA